MKGFSCQKKFVNFANRDLEKNRRREQFFFWKNYIFFGDTPPVKKKKVGSTFLKEFFNFDKKIRKNLGGGDVRRERWKEGTTEGGNDGQSTIIKIDSLSIYCPLKKEEEKREIQFLKKW